MKLFDLDGPLYRIGTELADLMILTLYWIICSLPIITIGASTTAVFYVYGKKVRGEDAYITKDFFKSFKENFLTSIPITLGIGVLWLSCALYRVILLSYNKTPSIILAGVALFLMLEASIMTIYVFAILSRFHLKGLGVFFTAFVLSHKHLVTSILMVALIVLLQYAALVFPLMLLVTPVLAIALCSFFIQKNFTLHIKAAEEAQKRSQESDNELDEEREEEDEEDEDGEDNEKEAEEKSFLKYI